ncbi:MAG: gamma-glutamyltransferase [bacterium]|nr:gamma-glutamyltransferase [bacterium]
MDRPIAGPATRSLAVSRRGAVASSQPLATVAGIHALREGGNAVDAAIAMHAVMGVTEPHSSTIGGDAFALLWEPAEGRVVALNGSGGASMEASSAHLRGRGLHAMPERGGATISVPGAVRAFETLGARYGRRGLRENLAEAIAHAEEGFPLAEVAAAAWSDSASIVERYSGSDILYAKRVRAGEVVRAPELARTLRAIAQQGAEAFYEGEIAASLIRTITAAGGVMTRDDLRAHRSQWVEPISTSYRGVEVFAPPPNGQGIAGLQMLNILEGFDLRALGHNTADYLHVVIEAKRLAHRDLARHLGDPDQAEVPIRHLLDKAYGAELRARIRLDRTLEPAPEAPARSGTVYAAAVDAEGRCCSLISSVYMNFGSGVVDRETGVLLQNRAALFSLEPGHPNELAPGRRPYHTIVPWMLTRDGRPWMALGIVGGEMQPQGAVQILCNAIDFEMGLQAAIESDRVRHSDDSIAAESGIGAEVRAALAAKGHRLVPGFGKYAYGGAQAIAIDPASGVRSAASDPRKDGVALGL